MRSAACWLLLALAACGGPAAETPPVVSARPAEPVIPSSPSSAPAAAPSASPPVAPIPAPSPAASATSSATPSGPASSDLGARDVLAFAASSALEASASAPVTTSGELKMSGGGGPLSPGRGGGLAGLGESNPTPPGGTMKG